MIKLTYEVTKSPDFGGFLYFVEAGDSFDADDYASAYKIDRNEFYLDDVQQVQDAAARLSLGEWLEVSHEAAGYRAAIYLSDSQSETVLTGPESAALPDDALYAEAVRTAVDAGLIGDEPHQVSEADLLAALYIGEWRESAADL
jgi:hypothetical protein